MAEGIRRDLGDDFVDRYVSWREASAGAQDLWSRWRAAGESDPLLWCAAYGAALDREEAAARELHACVARIHRTYKVHA